MATVNLYLDARRPRKDGSAQVKLTVNHSEGNTQIPLGVYVMPAQWDVSQRRVLDVHPFHARLNIMLQRMKLTADEAMLTVGNVPLAAAVRAITGALFPERTRGREAAAAKSKRPLLVDVARRYAELKSECSTRLTYERTVKHLEAFQGDALLNDVTVGWLEDFNAHMAKCGLNANSRAMMMRNLRAVFNYAIDEGLTANYPFRKFRIKTVQTRKRSMTAQALGRLLTMEVEDWQRPYRDFFALSFMLIGTNAKDILYMPAQADGTGRVEFNRAKTKKLYSIKVEPEAAALIERYRGRRFMLSIMEGRSDYMQFIRQCNHALKLIGTTSRPGCKPEGTPLFPEVTTYWARHSWATIAADLDIPKETIAAALGHDMGNSTTAIYINFNQRKVDEANRRVLNWVLYGRR